MSDRILLAIDKKETQPVLLALIRELSQINFNIKNIDSIPIIKFELLEDDIISHDLSDQYTEGKKAKYRAEMLCKFEEQRKTISRLYNDLIKLTDIKKHFLECEIF